MYIFFFVHVQQFSVMTYLSQMYHAFAKSGKRGGIANISVDANSKPNGKTPSNTTQQFVFLFVPNTIAFQIVSSVAHH